MKCLVCNLNDSKYKCPRCSIDYCSVACYKSHGNCSEEFYKDQVETTLQNTLVNEEQRIATLEMLDRLQIEDMEEEDDLLEEQRIQRMEGIYKRLQDGEDPDKVWLLLQEDEHQEFLKFINSGEASSLGIKENSLFPWYCDPISNGLVEDITISSENNRLPILEIPNNIVPILSLVPNGNISDLVKYNFIEIIHVYCFCYRLYAGEWNGDNRIEVIESILRLSHVLNPVSSSSRNFQAYTSIQLAIQSVIELSILPPFSNTQLFAVNIISDIIHVLEFKRRCIILLSHLYEFFNETQSYQKKGTSLYKRLEKIKHKLNFYLSWCDNQEQNNLNELKESMKPLLLQLQMKYTPTNTTQKNTPKILLLNKK